MILYKYSSSHHAMQAIQEKRLKVSRVNELNDLTRLSSSHCLPQKIVFGV